MRCGIPEKSTLPILKFKLVMIVRFKERETRATTGFKKAII